VYAVYVKDILKVCKVVVSDISIYNKRQAQNFSQRIDGTSPRLICRPNILIYALYRLVLNF